MKRLLWWLIAATRGGVNRARIIRMLHERPYNTNQLAEALELDYKTVQHHLSVLEKNKIIVSSGERYGKMYFLSDAMEENYDLFEDILDRMQGVDV
ncbi:MULTISPECIES: winged helix-turn-helix domain-containing protein [Methanothermobacter]|nr:MULTISPECIES: winged helix-turn-helix domain-containing protein [Methanothermobacter]QHN07611.1 winged helix-turn-helix transcriptional regulator [Methanothermobacter sp. THM-2]WBF09869.1 winged helix-turn-helix transcriptional regulator [Methanothermobacter marburgensis]